MKRELDIKNKTTNNAENTLDLGKATNPRGRDNNGILKLSFNNNSLQKNQTKTLNDTTFLEIFSGFCALIKTKKGIDEIFKCFNFYAAKLGYDFTAICIPNKSENILTVKTYKETTQLNSFQFSLSDEFNFLVQSYQDNSRKYASYKDLFVINCPSKNEYLTIPLISQGECIGTIIAGSNKRNREKDELLNNLSNYLALLINNHTLIEQLNSFNNIDNLTGFYTHRKFQETLSQVLEESNKSKQKVSVAIFDLNNIAKINREFGHLKGDEVISIFAKQIKNKLRKSDIAGRYGGDEVAVIMPNTEISKAKVIVEEILSGISENPIEKVGNISANVGIATYPTSATDQEKLLLLAEQSMLISENQGNEKGESSVVSSKDIDFWNKTALDSLSKVISRRNLHHKFKFEDELVKQFQNENKSSKIPLEVVTSLAAAIDAKDTYTKGHSHSVSKYAETLAKAAGLEEQEVEQVKLAAILHDVGKIGISESILRKPGALTDHEWEVMKQHPIIGVKKILEPIKSLKDLIPIVRHHHERYDGLGYPDRLKAEEIPLGARIVAIADSFHALISNRPYRKALGTKKALEILQSGAGSQWDKELVNKFILLTPIFFLDKRN